MAARRAGSGGCHFKHRIRAQLVADLIRAASPERGQFRAGAGQGDVRLAGAQVVLGKHLDVGQQHGPELLQARHRGYLDADGSQLRASQVGAGHGPAQLARRALGLQAQYPAERQRSASGGQGAGGPLLQQAEFDVDPLRQEPATGVQLGCQVGGDGELRLLLQRLLHGLGDHQVEAAGVSIATGIGAHGAHPVSAQSVVRQQLLYAVQGGLVNIEQGQLQGAWLEAVQQGQQEGGIGPATGVQHADWGVPKAPLRRSQSGVQGADEHRAATVIGHAVGRGPRVDGDPAGEVGVAGPGVETGVGCNAADPAAVLAECSQGIAQFAGGAVLREQDVGNVRQSSHAESLCGQGLRHSLCRAEARHSIIRRLLA